MTSDGFDIETLCRHWKVSALAELTAHPNESHRAATAVIDLAERAAVRWTFNTGAIACGPGCGSCCQLNVAILEPEADLLARHLCRHLSANRLQRMQEHLNRLAIRVSGLDDEERLACRIPCPLLDTGGNCSIHPVRPLMCRAITSTDAAACREAFALAALGETPRVLMNLRHRQIYAGAFEALATALAEAGRDDRSLPLILFLREKLAG
ncbi:MAG: YkgJ family cysteine cluster protein [Deltaproteobacteria bacterium]|nr:MAG: YkgJ family cysteine cluster protein [Deltaproteobacteria bacterium]